MEAFEREPNGTLREVLKRNILQMRDRLDQMLTELDTVQNPVERESIQPILTEKEIEETILEEVEEEKETLQVVEFQSQIEVQETIKNVSAGTILGEDVYKRQTEYSVFITTVWINTKLGFANFVFLLLTISISFNI